MTGPATLIGQYCSTFIPVEALAVVYSQLQDSYVDPHSIKGYSKRR